MKFLQAISGISQSLSHSTIFIVFWSPSSFPFHLRVFFPHQVIAVHWLALCSLHLRSLHLILLPQTNTPSEITPTTSPNTTPSSTLSSPSEGKSHFSPLYSLSSAVFLVLTCLSFYFLFFKGISCWEMSMMICSSMAYSLLGTLSIPSLLGRWKEAVCKMPSSSEMRWRRWDLCPMWVAHEFALDVHLFCQLLVQSHVFMCFYRDWNTFSRDTRQLCWFCP